MTIEKINAFKTSDGEIFQEKKAANAHQAKLDLDGWYDNNKLYGNTAYSYVHFEDLIKWLEENRTEVLQILKEW
jgi:hypothetical protein